MNKSWRTRMLGVCRAILPDRFRHSDYLYTVCPVCAGLSSYKFRYSDYRKTVCPRMCLAILWQILIFTQCAQVCAGLSYDRFRDWDYRIAGKSALPGNINLSHFILWNCIMIKQSWSVQYQLATHKFWVIKMKHTRGKESTTTQMFFFFVFHILYSWLQIHYLIYLSW